MATITKKELIDRIAGKLQIKRITVKKVVQEFLDQIIDDLDGNHRLEFRDFGVFECRQRPARLAQNPRTLDRVPVPSKRKVRFKAGRLLKQKLAKVVSPSDGQTMAAKAAANSSSSPTSNPSVSAGR